MSSSPLLALIDHGAGNLVSIEQALDRAGAGVVVTATPSELLDADGWVLPGVGATGATMTRLTKAGFIEPLQTFTGPLLGICVGMQLFFSASEEDGGECLGLDNGVVRRLVDAPRLPHIGWNDLSTDGDSLFDGLEAGSTFYFVHSFAPMPSDPSIVIATSTYGREFTAAVRQGNRVGVQFHPERSGRPGQTLLSNFVAEVIAYTGRRVSASAR